MLADYAVVSAERYCGVGAQNSGEIAWSALCFLQNIPCRHSGESTYCYGWRAKRGLLCPSHKSHPAPVGA